uniref:Calcium channel, voltage-dependent, gamma subunit 2b n=1 Tax=Gouania willdenowi TaxID=441366 RepID=A0A8C5D4D6_GOUWI
MGVFDRGVQMLLTTVGAFAAFSLMTIAVGTDYWLYSRGVCKIKSTNENETSKKNEEVMTHSGLWRTCCLEGSFKGMCKQIDHFPEDADYEADASEYFLRAVRASSIFPIMSVILLFMGGLCIAASIGMMEQINLFLRLLSLYFGALSFIMAEMVGVVLLCTCSLTAIESCVWGLEPPDYLQGAAITRIPSYRYRYRRRSRSSSRSTDPSHSREASPVGLKGFGTLAKRALRRPPITPRRETTTSYRSHNCIQKDLKDSGGHSNTANRRTTPV